MDKSSIYLKNHFYYEYWDGLSTIIEVGKNYANSFGHISCPCMKCQNHDMQPVEIVRAHIHWYDFDTMYIKWIHHGEAQTVLSTEPVVGELIDEMFAVLNDVAGINDENDMFDGAKAGIEDTEYDEFKDLLSELQVGLYPGYIKYSS